jgi:hypothetical protein
VAKNPSATWYFNDWENDPALKTCSLAAQGLWKRLICIAARSPEHGVVQIESQHSGLPHGLTLIASAVGRPPEEIAPLIDELLSSGTASRDRKGRLFCRKMVRAAALSAKRAVSGKLGADVTNGKRTTKEDLPRQTPRQTGGPSRLPSFESSSHKPSQDIAARASASPDGPPRPPLPDTAKWAARLDGYQPWLGIRTWQPSWGPIPDSAGHNPLIPSRLLAEWREKNRVEMAKLRSAA